MDPATIQGLLHLGSAGLMAAIFFQLYKQKDGELREERAARIKDAQDTLALVMKLQEQVSGNVSTLGKILDEQRKQRAAI